jgi:pimeloyl-ACP methyl ester carboxylesterase
MTLVTAATAPTLYLDVDGVSYAYREIGEMGDHPPLLLLHRFRGTLDDWDPGFVDAVAQHRKVILFSDAAIGTSTGTPATSVDEKARNAAGFARALGHTTVDVLGFSMGGFVAQALALDEPDLVRKVVLLGTGPGGNPENDPPTDIVFDIALKPDYEFDDFRYLFFAPGREQETQRSLERFGRRTADREPVVGSQLMQIMAGLVLAFMNGETKHFERLADLRQPSLIVAGDTDPFFPMKNQWLLFRELPDAQLAVYPNAGHGPHQQHPEEVAAQVARFLSLES